MFWQSLIAGLKILSYWQVWLVILLYIAINFVFIIIMAKFLGKDEADSKKAIGCLFYIIGSTLLHAILMGLMIAFLLPILLGGHSLASIFDIIASLPNIIKASAIAIITVIILSIIPLTGAFVSKSQGIQAFLEGVIIFRILSAYSVEHILNSSNVHGSVYPGFWATIGFLIIASIIVWTMTFGLALLCVHIENTALAELISIFIGPLLGTLGGIITLFMYSSYVQLSIANLVGR